MRYTRTAITQLTKMYRSVLKKCAFLNAIMLAGVISASPSWADIINVATADQLYNALQASSEITVTNDITDVAGTIVYNQTNTVNLNGKTLSGPAEGNSGFIFNTGSLTLTGGGTISDFSHPTTNLNSTSGSQGVLEIHTDTTMTGGDWIISDNLGGYAALNVVNKNLDANVSTITFKDNKSNAQGAALRHDVESDPSWYPTTSYVKIIADEIVFDNNSYVEGSKVGGGAAAFNAASTMQLLGAENTFTNNKNNVDPSLLGRELKAGGGAIENQASSRTDSTMVIGTAESINTFSNNSSMSQGGAIMNRSVGSDKNAYLTINGTSTFSENHADLNGGAIFNIDTNSGAATVASVTLSDNTTFENNTASISGGAIYNSGDFELSDSTFTGNTAGQIGGAVYNEGTMTIADATFGGNTAALGNSARVGGAVYNTGDGSITFDGDITFKNNTALRGGALVNDSATGSVTFNGAAEFTSNSSTGTDGGGEGGALQNVGIVTFNDTATFTNNTASSTNDPNGQGGAIWNTGTVVFEKLATFTGNKGEHKGNAITNEADGVGDGIMIFKGGLTLSNNSYSDTTLNTTTVLNYGDMYVYGGDISVTNNTAHAGAGILSGNDSGTPAATLLLGAYKEGGNIVEAPVDNITFKNNTATTSTAGGLYAQTGNVELYANNITFDNNDSSGGGYGGAVAAQGATLKIIGNNNTFTNNDANGTTITESKKVNFGGGAIQNRGLAGGSTIIVGNNTSVNLFDNNTSVMHGGAIHIRPKSGETATTTINGTSTFSNNKATLDGGAVSNYATGTGVSDLTLDGSSTFTGNTAGGLGGAIYNSGTTTISGEATFADNKAAGKANDIYNTGTLNLVATAGKIISLAGGIDGSAGTTNITGAGTVEAEFIKNQTVAVDSGELHLSTTTTDGSNLAGSDITIASGVIANTIDDVINDYATGGEGKGTITLADGANVKLDASLAGTASIDTYAIASGDTVTISELKVLTDTENLNEVLNIAELGNVDIAEGLVAYTSANKYTVAGNTTNVGTITITRDGAGGLYAAAEDTEAGTRDLVTYNLTADDTTTNAGAATITNADMTIQGTGTDNEGKKVVLANDLTVGATAGDSSNLTITSAIFEEGETAGQIENAGTGSVNVNESSIGVDITNSGAGSVNISGGTISGAIANIGTGDVNIDGAQVTNDGLAAAGEIISNAVGADLTITNTTFAGGGTAKRGRAITNAGTYNNDDNDFDGFVFGNGAVMENTNVANPKGDHFTNNIADETDRTVAHGGGAIWNSGNLTIEKSATRNSLFSGNKSYTDGGAIYNDAGGTLIISDTSFTGNSANASDGMGGAIYNAAGATLTVTDTTFSGNKAAFGDDIYNAGTATVLASTEDMTVNDIYNEGTLTLNAEAGQTLTIGGISDTTGNGATTINSTTVGTVVFSGNVENDITVVDGILESNADYLGGSITNNAALNLTGGTLAQDIAGGGVTNINGNVAAGGDIDIANATNINAGGSFDVGTNNVSLGDTTVNGTLKVKITDAANGQLTVTNMTIDNNAKLDMTVGSGVLTKRGDTLDLNVINITDGSTGDDKFANDQITGNLRYAITANDDGSYKVTSVASSSDVVASAGGSINNMQTANAWDNAKVPAGTIASLIKERLNEVSQRNAAVYADAMTNVAPTDTAMYQGMVLQLGNLIGEQVASRLSSQGMNSGDVFERQGAWVKALYNHAEQDSSHTNPGFTGNTKGIAFGLDGEVNESTTVGIGYAYSETDADSLNRDVDIKGHNFFAYGKYQPSAWFVRGMINYGLSDYEEKSHVLGFTKTADYDVKSYGLRSYVGYDLPNGFTPEAGLRYTHITVDDYTDSFGQRISTDDIDVLTATLGINFQKEVETAGYKWTPKAHVNFTYDLENDGANATVLLGNSGYNIKGEALDRFGIEAGVGAEMNMGDWSLSAEYEYGYRSDFENHTGMLQLKYNF